MSETETAASEQAPAVEEAPAPKKRGRPPKAKPAEEPKEEIPSGMCYIYVARPDRVSGGDESTTQKLPPGAKVMTSIEAAEVLEERSIAFRSEEAAKANFEIWKRTEEKRIAEEIMADERRRENRRIAKEQKLKDMKIQWEGA